MATSRKYNPGQRTFHSLRERYRKHLRTRLAQYVNATQQELLLNLPPGTLSKARGKNKMTSKQDAKEELERGKRTPIGDIFGPSDSEVEETVVEPSGADRRAEKRIPANAPLSNSPRTPSTKSADARLVNVLLERSRLLSRSGAENTLALTSTPLPPVKWTDSGIEDVENRLKNAVADQGSHTWRQQALEYRSGADAPLSSESGRNVVLTQTESNLTEQGGFEKNHTVELRISNGLEFCFKFEHLGSTLKMANVDLFLSRAQIRLRDMLLGHGKPLEEGRQTCSNENCVGLEAYLDCWVELQTALFKAERFEGLSSHPFFVRLLAARVYDLLLVPTCTQSVAWSDAELDPAALYSFFRDESTSLERRIVRAIIETASALRKALPKCVQAK